MFIFQCYASGVPIGYTLSRILWAYCIYSQLIKKVIGETEKKGKRKECAYIEGYNFKPNTTLTIVG